MVGVVTNFLHEAALGHSNRLGFQSRPWVAAAAVTEPRCFSGRCCHSPPGFRR